MELGSDKSVLCCCVYGNFYGSIRKPIQVSSWFTFSRIRSVGYNECCLHSAGWLCPVDRSRASFPCADVLLGPCHLFSFPFFSVGPSPCCLHRAQHGSYRNQGKLEDISGHKDSFIFKNGPCFCHTEEKNLQTVKYW